MAVGQISLLELHLSPMNYHSSNTPYSTVIRVCYDTSISCCSSSLTLYRKLERETPNECIKFPFMMKFLNVRKVAQSESTNHVFVKYQF